MWEGIKAPGEGRVAAGEAEVAGMELYLEEKRKAGIDIQGSLAAGFLPQLLCAQGWAFPPAPGKKIQAVPEAPARLCSRWLS